MTIPRPVRILMFAAVFSLVVSAAVNAKPKTYQKGVLLQMESTACGFQEDKGQSLAGSLLGTDNEKKRTRETLCQEYVLRSDRIIFRIRPKEEKKPVLLPVGDTVEFRIDKHKLMLRVPEDDGKEREYVVISMTPREDTQTTAKKQ